mmetsp:Transcript_56531/g.183753  ORF Transcript_56531/g.183753 Transcript_56531/m.183753 type:complete len:722 (-) Transcript_56531:197-2362(-)|eukprot:CAMPEP_0203926622 /NCGR_PEP_ID=MMETSP0359-20131031/66135_1 /ASSEMBLY_ACC=CAM_ASM_000338 /TAXON_ID=268821 /ORGANISM="Scrippsiella Hangoei, Strain SHTV-5" /LENGTH=721 /DNA_ID=CAMNT_0050855261 /DNA_START=42 /DNA_END=2207 /DNA_ORIENTATION=+
MMSRRPPPMAPLGRVCVTTQKAEEGLRGGDEESLREELQRLRATVIALRREEADAREKLMQSEAESYQKDKLLQEMLASAKGGNGVPGEALDQLREDLQLVLHVKGQSFQTRQQLDEKDNKLVTLQQELKATQAHGLEEEVAAAKAQAKAMAEEWQTRAQDGGSAAVFMSLRQEADALAARIDAAQSAGAGRQARRAELDNERRRYECEAESNARQIEQLRAKRDEVDQELEECKAVLVNFQQLTVDKMKLNDDIVEKTTQLQKAREDLVAGELRGSMASKLPTFGVCSELLVPGFTPLRSSVPSAEASSWLLWRLRQALAVGEISGLELLLAEDTTGDGRLSPHELAGALERINLPGPCSAAVEQLFRDLNDEMVVNGRVSALDLVLALPLQRRPPAPAAHTLGEALEAVVWACRRFQKTEGEIRRRLVAWIDDASTVFGSDAQRLFCGELRLDSELADTLGRGIELLREGLLAELPSWHVPRENSRTSLLLRLLRDIALHRDVLAERLDSPGISLEAFVGICSELGPSWTRRDLEEVAFMAETSPERAVPFAPPVVDGARLVRASELDGYEAEFPDACLAPFGALEALHEAIRGKSRVTFVPAEVVAAPAVAITEAAVPAPVAAPVAALAAVPVVPAEATATAAAVEAVSAAVAAAAPPPPPAPPAVNAPGEEAVAEGDDASEASYEDDAIEEDFDDESEDDEGDEAHEEGADDDEDEN